MKIEIKTIDGSSCYPINIDLAEGRLSITQCNVTFEPGDFEAKEISISGCIINVPTGCHITDRNGTNFIRTMPDESTYWFKCDKGYFGVPGKNRRNVEELIDFMATEPIVLLDMMTWAVQNDIPYKISTVEPKNEG